MNEEGEPYTDLFGEAEQLADVDEVRMLGDTIRFSGGNYEVRGIVDDLYVVRIRFETGIQRYALWSEGQRQDFEAAKAKPSTMSNQNAARNAFIYERRLKGETYRSLSSEYGLSHSRLQQIVAREARKRSTG